LADFEKHREEIEARGAWIVAGSSDSISGAQAVVEDLGLNFVMLYGLDAESVSEAIGCYTGEREGKPHIQPASFIVSPAGSVDYSVYSSGKMGRLTARDALQVLPARSDGD